MNQTKTRNRRTRIYRRYARAREFLLLVFKKYNVTCYFCNKPLGEKDLPLKRTDKLTIHHINGDHSDDRTENKAFCHRSCHRSFHLAQLRKEEKAKKRGSEKMRENETKSESNLFAVRTTTDKNRKIKPKRRKKRKEVEKRR